MKFLEIFCAVMCVAIIISLGFLFFFQNENDDDEINEDLGRSDEIPDPEIKRCPGRKDFSNLQCPAGMVAVPGGIYPVTGRMIIGDKCENPRRSSVIKESQCVEVESFCIDKYEASQPDATAVFAGSRITGDRPVPAAQSKKNKLPWVNISWFDAKKSCENAGKRLPGKAEWQVAFQSDGKLWPWGKNRYVKNGCHVNKPEGIYPTGACCFPARGGKEYSELGAGTGESCAECVCDMVGNVSEWVNETVYQTGCPKEPNHEYVIILGGCAHQTEGAQNTALDEDGDGCFERFCAYSFDRNSIHFHGPNAANPDDGFRCAMTINP